MPLATTMNLAEVLAISASSLWAHKLRSVLTLIGVVIGVAAVIAGVSLINGANQYVATRVFRLRADVFCLSKQPSLITNGDDWLPLPKRERKSKRPKLHPRHNSLSAFFFYKKN